MNPALLHEAFEAQAARTPGALAVLAPDGGRLTRLTYAELDERSARMGRFLRGRGVGPEIPVGVCMERSAEMVVAMLGVLKAGGVYLPLDPAYPADRLAFMLEDSGAAIALTREGLAGQVPAGAWETVAVDDPRGPLAAPDAGRGEPGDGALPAGLAYLIYTSGSTGRPKGVGVPHTAAALHIEIAAELFGLREGERMLWFASPSFDISIEEVFAPLARGATVVVREPALWSPAELLARAAELRLDVVDLPTAYWHQWAAESERMAVPAGLALRLVVLGGEAMSGEAARRWWRSPLAGIPLLNGYGPTETIVTSTAFAVDAGAASEAAGTVPIGIALAGRSAWVLDPSGSPATDGVAGELCLGGSLLARGYLGRPELTADRFVPDPFAGEPGARLYRTGDLARRRSDGILEFLGRADRQLKVRGFRVEPGEIESALARHAGVREAVVDVRAEGSGGQRLLAWIVPAGPAPEPEELASFLRESLPDHMVPSAFLTLAELPLTPNGKVNLRALPVPAHEIEAAARDTALTHTPTEELLAGLWASILGIPEVAASDHFFTVGGHSLLAVQLLSRIRDVFGVELSLRDLLGAPVLADQAARIDAALRGGGEPLVPSPVRGPRPAHPPLSFAQHRLWLVERLQSSGAAYNLVLALRLSGPLDLAALAAALGELTRRHETLRTRFAEADGQAWQEVLPAAAPALPLIDLGNVLPDQRDGDLDRLAQAEVRRPFDLAAGPLLRACLLRLERTEHLLVLTLHHAVSDGLSQDIVRRELAVLYTAYMTGAAGLPSPLPELPLQYADFALWQREWLSESVLAEQLAVWRRRLSGTAALELPTDRPRPALWSFRGAGLTVPLPADLAAATYRLARREGATPFMVVLAAFQALLGRTAGQDDFAVGTPSANRRPEVEGVVGFFVNMLPLRASLGGAPDFRGLVARVRETALEAYGHQDLPFERLVEDLAPERDLGRNPIFQVAFQLFYETPPPPFAGLAAAPVDLGTGTAKFDLSLEVAADGDVLSAAWEYATDLFDPATIRRLADHLGSLLAGALAAPETAVGELPWLGEEERHQLLLEWNDTAGGPVAATGVHRLVESQARLRPEALAVAAAGEELTYGELVHRAGLLAGRLRGLGAGPETLVAVCLERSPELIVTLLAVLEAGAAYLPLDPALPGERLSFLLSDSRAGVLVGRRGAAGGWQPSGVPCLWLDEAGDAAPAAALREDGASPENLAYVIYTSGSTGLPKGVEVGHRSLLNLVAWHVGAFGLTAADRSTQVAQIAFDASVWEIWPVLAAGASLHLPAEAVRTAPERLRDWLVEEGITVSFLPTPLAEAVLPLDWPAGTALRTLLTGGDRLRQPPAPSLPFTLVNNYGPTEATVVATSAAVPPRAAIGTAAAPAIGRAIFNGRVHILDAAGQPVPTGVAGELYVGGAGLARGYRGRPDLTAEKFVPDFFASSPGGRLYRTGDRVRLLPAGDVEFLGRTDQQIKVRGFRIEPGEIEAALLGHRQVGECAVGVATGEDGAGEARLVAWIVPAGEAPAAAELRSFLAARLPSYMVPAAYVTLAALPLTATGKVDRKALPAPSWEAGEAPGAFHDPVEEVIAGLWMDLLGTRGVGPHDDFFALGGHSLRATQLASRLRQVFGVDLPLRAVFEAPTVARLAERVRMALGGGQKILLPPIAREPRPGRIPLSFAQQRLWFLDLLEPDRALYNIPTAAALSGPLDAAALEAAFAAVIHRHEALRTRILEVDGLPWQEVAAPGPAPLPLVDLTALPSARRDEERERVARDEARRPFDLSRGPLLRGVLIRLAARETHEEHALLLTIHHIVSDAWSEDILRRELSALYAAALAGTPSPLPALPVQYADFALWQRRWPAELLDSQLEHWRARLDGLAVLELPTDRPRPPVQGFRGAVEPLEIPAALLAGLREVARQRGATLFMTLLAAWQTLLGRLSGQTDVAVGSPMANRNRGEVEGLIGFFINMLAYRGDLGGDPPFGELLARVGRMALDAYEHRDVPFERLVDELRPERDLSRQPLVQVMIALQDTAPESLELPGVAVAAFDSGTTISKFDLTLYLEAAGDGLAGTLEYSTDLFDRATILRLSGHLLNVLAAVAARPGIRLSEIGLLAPAERFQLLGEWNDTRAPYPEEVLLHQFFEAAADRTPGAPAAAWLGAELSYGGLEARANRIANLLLGRGLRRGQPVGVWMERSFDMVASVLAILKAGGYYLPLDAAWPAERVEGILATSEAPALLTRSAHLGPVLGMRWRLPALASVVCLDEEAPAPPPEPLDAGGVRALFDLVAERAVDRATAGGFVSSFTGAPFSEAEVDEYRDRVLGLAAPWLGAGRRVLEIGCGSGLLLWEMAARSSRCVGLDPSPLTQERNRAEARRRGLDQVELPVGFAHEIEGWPAASFDLVLLASTAQFFPGPLYLEKVAGDALRLLAPGGALLIADVPDARRQGELRRALEEHHAGTGGLPARPDILSLDEDLFRDLAALPGAGEVSIRHREQGFDNELRFRYDVLMSRSETGTVEEGPRARPLLTSWHVERQAADRPAAVAAPDDLAYVIYTSGSTGQPKGIAVQHRPVANLVGWLNPAFGIGPDDRVLFVTSLCFDLSVYDIFGLLAAGGCVRIAAEEELRDPERLVRMLAEEDITLWDSAPAALVRLAPLFPSRPAAASRLRRVMLSGDWIPVSLPDRVRAAFPGALVTSLGGATEATIWSNFYPVGEVDPRWPSIPYGRPIHNALYRVLDAGLEPCPVGVPGDLYIGGDVLCTGYAGQPAVTAAAFLPDPFAGAERAGARLYRTGDRARYFADGNLEFLGRLDQQVKIRGFRIELGEIEVALARHPAVREAVVLARGEAGDKRLVAYVVPPAGEAAPGKAELRDFLRRALPDYMIPSAFVPLAALPVTANGKLDRRALPAPGRETAGEETAALPCTPTEEILAGLWRELLGIERVAVTDNFFELGGHSLLATQLVARLRQAFAAEVPLRTLFQTPNLAALAAALDALAPAAAGSPEAACPIAPMPRGGELPLSASQLRQWFLVQLEPESVDYNLPLAFGLTGALRPEVLAAALREIARRHEALRTTFTAVAGRPVAVASPEVALPLPLLDLSALPEACRRTTAAHLAAEEHDRPFDLTRGPLLRTLLIRLSAGEHLLAATVHHIVFDGWSLGVFLGELAALYEAFDAGRPSPLPELPVQYADYAAWQQEWLASPDLDAQLAHWKERLGGSTQALELPTDRPRPTVQTHRGELLPLAVPPELAAGLKTLAAREGVTLFMVLLSGFSALLSRYTGQEDLNVGTFVANRRWEAVERLIGFFVNTLVLRADLTGEPGFRDLLLRARDTALDAFDHQEVPIERLLDELDTERDLSRPPLFQVMFGVQNFAMPDQQVPGLSIRPVEVTEHSRTNADLAFWMWEQGEGLSGWLQFSTDLYDGATVQRMFGHLASLLAGAVAEPLQRLSELPLLAAAEQRQIVGWSAAPPHPQAPRLVHERLREQARLTPSAVAVVAGGLSLTYGELDRRSGLVARGLRRLGAGPETVVGLSIDRSPEMIVALFGILRAGAAYLPLDPKLPADRLTLLMEDAGVTGVLTRNGFAAELPPLPARLLLVDGDFEAEDSPEEVAAVPESTAYVLYTSGSTGAPKGVIVEHRALAAFTAAAVEAYGIGPRDRVLQFASLSFDASVEEIYPCLAVGGTLVLRDDEMIASPIRFLDACREAGVTVLDLPTAYWHELAAVPGGAPPLPPALRLIILGGEAVLPERVSGWLAATGPRPRLFNTYGPTEGTVVATACDLGEAAPAVPIGRPLRGVEAHLLDRGLWPVPAGVAGEICLGGAGLARGYLGRPDTTAERFVPAPSGPPGARLYRTGDLGRWGSDGRIEFAGRADDQVKIRGFRIEPGEVAAVLARHPAVGEVVVTARESGPGERRLAAYAVPKGDSWPAVSELRAFLKERLPAYMVPADFVLLAALPRTRTGKVDRRALAAHGTVAPVEESYTPPSTLTEEMIAAIWQELLGVERVGIYDNFFDLGGHSLLAPQVFSRIEDTFEVQLALRILFEAPTVAEMANAVERILLEQIEGLSEEEAADLAGSEH